MPVREHTTYECDQCRKVVEHDAPTMPIGWTHVTHQPAAGSPFHWQLEHRWFCALVCIVSWVAKHPDYNYNDRPEPLTATTTDG